jgi:predicted O-linked N-acetylglucosamine transferase (SPINDLY family)
VLERAGRIPYALAGSDFALALMPASAETKRNIRLHQQVRANAERALARDPNNVTAWHKLGDALSGLKRPKQAIACYDKALALAPYNTVIWKKRTIALEASGETADPANAAVDVRDADAWGVQANRLFSSRQFSEAIDASDRALELDPESIDAARIGIQARLFACDWDRREADKRRISEGVAAGRRIITPFYHRTISDSEAEHLVLAKIWAKGLLRAPTAQGQHNRHRSGKIRIAYMSTDFRSHVVADMIVGCFEHHDKTRFETTAISLGPDDGSAMRRRIEAAFDRFVDAGTMSDLNIAGMVRELDIDILIDLNGNSGEQRTGVLSHRPAPVQVIYLGYPGTMGLPFIDYIIADRVVIPEENRVHYSEQVVYLPHTYMPTDRMRPIAPTTPSRAEAGLPETGFVFACHNHEHKIAPEVFDVWMRLLQACEGSVLWLKALNSAAVINLRRQAKNCGVAPDRLIFAPNEPLPENHLARLRLADLFLDTLPYNAHATACDALWAGLPVLTCAGNAFPGRVAASVLHAVGLPEMVTASLADYEALAIMLARNPERLAAIRAKLLRNRDTEPLFDTARFTRDLESAYTRMWERYLATTPAATFVVEPSS